MLVVTVHSGLSKNHTTGRLEAGNCVSDFSFYDSSTGKTLHSGRVSPHDILRYVTFPDDSRSSALFVRSIARNSECRAEIEQALQKGACIRLGR